MYNKRICLLSSSGFRKILKKHDKNLREYGSAEHQNSGAKWRSEHVDTAHFYTNKSIDKLIQETEGTFISELEGGDRQRAMKRLRVPPLGDQQSPWTTFKVGLFSGAFVVLIIAVVLSAIFHDYDGGSGGGIKGGMSGGGGVEWRVVFRLYRGPLLIILFIFLMGINVYGWR